MFQLHLLTHGYAVPLAALRMCGVRIHSGVISHGGPWLRLWYFLRWLDSDNRGWLTINTADCCQILDCAPSTLYEWLREGRKEKAIRAYRIRRGKLKIWLGGLMAFCQAQDLETWGSVETLSIDAIASESWQTLKEQATLLDTYQLQEQSRYAARHKLSRQERNFYRIPSPRDILKRERTSQEPEGGQCPFLLHVGRSKVFVSKGFVPYGGSQREIAERRNCSDRTVRRHLSNQKIVSRQLVQAKEAYRLVLAGLKWEADHCSAEPRIEFSNGRLTEPNGISSAIHTSPVTPRHFFKYAGKVWRYRCSIYLLDHSLTSMRMSRKRYKKLMRQNQGAGGVELLGELINGLDSGEECLVNNPTARPG